jgi:hypothetical protein
MTRAMIIAIAASFAGFAALSAPASAETLTVKPLQAATLAIGSDHAVSYFTNDGGRCNLVVTRAGEPDWDQNSLEVNRFETSIHPGKSSRYDGSVEFSCAADAQSMQIRQDEQVAGSNAK